jgi:hypothetical protein
MKHDDVLLMQFEACRFSARIRLRSTRNNGNVNLRIFSDVGRNGVRSNEHQLVLADGSAGFQPHAVADELQSQCAMVLVPANISKGMQRWNEQGFVDT